MKKFLLPESGSFYKANLHCHSTYSDGRLTPEELKKIYKERGYSIIAYTDHDLMVSHEDLADEDFLPLTGYEMEITEPANGRTFDKLKTCHICLIALDPDNKKQVCWHRSKYLPAGAAAHRDEANFYEDEPDYERVYTPEKINEMIKIARDHGFFVTYNHPYWSLENYSDYTSYEGMNAMEIFNACYVVGYLDYNPQVYDDMLRTGHRIYCIAADDNHNGGTIDTKPYTSFKGATMIKADKLEYRTITEALEKGNFYATTGPEIKELWFEDDTVHIRCSEAESITLNSGIRQARIKWAEDGSYLTEASFKIAPDWKYIRLTVTDYRGKHANTNAYFTDELFDET